MGTATTTLSLCQWPSSSFSSSSLRMHVRFSCRTPHLSASAVDKTFCQINNSSVIACRANSLVFGGNNLGTFFWELTNCNQKCALYRCFQAEGVCYSNFLLGILFLRGELVNDEKKEKTLFLRPKEVAMEAANAATTGGISVVLQQLVKEHPTMALGDIMVMDSVQSGEILYIPGTMTPTEILSACDAGAKMVKVGFSIFFNVYLVEDFCIRRFQYISTLKKPLPHVSMVASQGITIDAIEEYILRGASSVVLSDAIFDKETIAQHNFSKIHKLAHSAALLGNKAVNRIR
ncbi:hypothetical protein E2542_SST08068 [Spatholobus suberectus]|nr:hypothetical protein E2542_SST08068 [Spatholobus suberectus]